MRICIVGDPYGVHDIGERKAVSQIVHGLRKNNDVLVLEPKDILSSSKVKKLRNFQPDIVHYWAGPKFRSFVILWAFKVVSGAKLSLTTAIRPELSRLGLRFASCFSPDLLLAQSEFYLTQFRRFGFNAQFFPNGVDTSKFYGVDESKRRELRKRHSVPADNFVILHIGHITPWRSLGILNELAVDEDNYVLIVGSTSLFKPDPEVLASLKLSGCDVRLEFFPDIAEIYQLSDCYVFPGGAEQQSDLPFLIPEKKRVPAIEIPLSVLEARACGLNVVTSRFGGLEHLFASDEGVHFCNSAAEILEAVGRIRTERAIPLTHKNLMRYDWTNVLTELIKHYNALSSSLVSEPS